MQNNPEQLSPKEDLQADNAIKALNLELKYGAFHAHISDDAPPEIISQWLDNVTNYEDQYAKAGQITIHAFIGKPAVRPGSEISKTELEPEIERLMTLLEEHCVMTVRPAHLNPKAFYRFLSEEFMQHQMTNYTAPGMVHFFPYEEFHRDGPEFMEAHVGDFIQDLMALDRPYEGLWLSENLRDDQHLISKAEAFDRINTFRSSYQKIELGAFTPIKLETPPNGIYFIFEGEWFGTPLLKGGELEHHEGPGVIQLGFEDGDWLVQGVMMPGFKF